MTTDKPEVLLIGPLKPVVVEGSGRDLHGS